MTTELLAEQEIRSSSRPGCILCGSAGEFIHREQSDRLFGAPGLWNLKRCSTAGCGLVWLDPMPLPEEIGKAYANYYTHTVQQSGRRGGGLKQAWLVMKRGYLANQYGYGRESTSPAAKMMGRLLHLLPYRRSNVDVGVRFLSAAPQGRLLDVGCGSGEWLVAMRDLGWQVEGVDFDENAVRLARDNDLLVRCGSLEEQKYPAAHFDAVTLNHVIEHVPDPIGTLKECARILKPGGRLALFTPNTASLGHRLFGSDWRGLEPPRHLHVFCPGSMAALLHRAGFSNFTIATTNTSYVWEFSLRLWTGKMKGDVGFTYRALLRFGTALLTLAEQALLALNPRIGECLAVQAVKSS